MQKSRVWKRAVCLFLCLAFLVGLFAVPVYALNNNVFPQINFTGLELKVRRGIDIDYASYNFEGGNYVETWRAPNVTIMPDDELVFFVRWEVPAANMAIVNDDYFDIPIVSSDMTFADSTVYDLIDSAHTDPGDSPPGKIGTWQVESNTIKVVFNAAVAQRTALTDGYFTIQGKAGAANGSAGVSIGGSSAITFPIEPRPGGTIGPMGTPEAVAKERFTNTDDNLTWLITTGNDSMATYFGGGTPPAMHNVAIEDTLLDGQTMTASDITIHTVLLAPYYDPVDPNNSKNGQLTNAYLTYLNIKNMFTEVDGSVYGDAASFKAAVMAQAPAYGVYDQTYVVIAPGSLNDGATGLKYADALDRPPAQNGVGGNFAGLLADYDTRYSSDPLYDVQKAQLQDAYYNAGNRINGGVMSLRILLKTTVTGLPNGVIDNEVVVSHAGGITGESGANFNRQALGGGVQGTPLGKVTLTKRDAQNSDRLAGVGFALHKWDGAKYTLYSTKTAYTNALGVVQFSGLDTGRYKIVETNPLQGYTGRGTYSPSDEFEIDRANGAIAITLEATNQRGTYVPPEDEDVSIPDDNLPGPGTSTPPNNPQTPTTTPETGSASPQTGDTNSFGMWAVLAVVSLGGLCTFMRKRPV